ncbi:MAG: hypothetical protein P8011_15895 [Acidihalobacter sp.]|jgi:hypothetical protein|uniref:hypothetical protein n=1 Tax=Acidihalobacter sp. TaxID=1872108 RepID=UPI00307F34DB
MARLFALTLLVIMAYGLLKTAEGLRTLINRRVLGPEPAAPEDIALLRREVALLREEVAHLRGKSHARHADACDAGHLRRA